MACVYIAPTIRMPMRKMVWNFQVPSHLFRTSIPTDFCMDSAIVIAGTANKIIINPIINLLTFPTFQLRLTKNYIFLEIITIVWLSS